MAKRKSDWKIEKLGNNVHRFTVQTKGDTVYPVLFISDLHWDNPHCDRRLLKRHLDQALELMAPVIIVGDMFCAMQGKYDRRSCKDSLRQEHQSGQYLDRLVDTAADWFEPYKNIIAVVGYGNHETSILGNHETDLLDRFASQLRRRGGITTTGGYNGWLKFSINCSTTRCGFDFYYSHGSGGGSAVTKGITDFNRWREQVTSDALICGHIHRATYVPNLIASLNSAGNIEQRQLDYVRCSTYKDEFDDGAMGWHNERQGGPRILGGWWCEWKGGRQAKRRWVVTDQ